MKKNVLVQLESIAKDATRQESMSVAEHYEELLYELLDKLKEVPPAKYLHYYKNPNYKLHMELVVSNGYHGIGVSASVICVPAHFSPEPPKTLASVYKDEQSLIAKKTSMSTDFKTLYKDIDGIELCGEPFFKKDDPYKGKASVDRMYVRFSIDN